MAIVLGDSAALQRRYLRYVRSLAQTRIRLDTLRTCVYVCVRTYGGKRRIRAGCTGHTVYSVWRAAHGVERGMHRNMSRHVFYVLRVVHITQTLLFAAIRSRILRERNLLLSAKKLETTSCERIFISQAFESVNSQLSVTARLTRR